MAVALLVTLVPPLLFAASWQEWIYKGLTLLLIGCPCALVISTPAAITSGLAAAARRGLRHHFSRLMIVVINQGNPGTGTYPMYTSFPDKVIVIHGTDNACSDKTRAFNITVW